MKITKILSPLDNNFFKKDLCHITIQIFNKLIEMKLN